MKKLSILALALLASSVFANGGSNGGGHGGGGPTVGSSVSIGSTSRQGVAMIFSAVRNKAEGNGAVAQQNVSSNSGNVAHANAMAVQNLASNNGCVTCDGGTTVGGQGR